MGVLGYEPLEINLPDGCETAPRGARDGDRVQNRSLIREIAPGSPADRAGLEPGDRLISINGEPIRDPIDLMFHAAESELDLRLRRADPKSRALRRRIERKPGEDLGIILEDFKVRVCNNNCVFCFIHQNPPGLRRGIYFKDGDFRMSFLHGNYITTTNMSDADFDRIVEQRLSPLYISVHATDHDLRLKMLGVKRSANILDRIDRLTRARIGVHAQIVLCPGWNDGAVLDQTIEDLIRFRPGMLSIAIVPIGLTDHREGLPAMAPSTPRFCKSVIARIEPVQERLRAEQGEPIVYLADEFYVTAGKAPPSYEGLDVLHQLENGVGMVWDFMRPWRRVARGLPARLPRPRRVAILTGLLGARVLRNVARRLARIQGLEVVIIPCLNGLFGRAITVSGLLCGADFLRSIAENPGHDQYLIPGNAVRADGEVFLDDMKLDDLNRASKGKVRAVDGDCADLVGAILADPNGTARMKHRRTELNHHANTA